MERDFLGLSSKNPVVKEENVDGGRSEDDSAGGFRRSSGVPWLFPSKVSVTSQFPSVKSEHDEKQAKNPCTHFLNRVPVSATPVSVLPTVTEQWMKTKPPSQLTIFYGGAVTVFDDISPEKAKAIILMAAKGSHHPQSYLAQPKTCIPNAATIASPLTPGKDDELAKVEPPPTKMIPSATAMMSAAVPQARKASLARFLEKRKERVMSAAPYTVKGSPAISGAGSNSGKEIADDA